jgi:alpha-galactosidase
MKHLIELITLILLALFPASPCAAVVTKPVRVFILAGQSNMEGHGFVPADPKRNGGKGSLEFVAKDPTTAQHFAPLVDAAGKWRTRDDVWINYLDRNGPLTVGFGARAEMIGPELGFGWVMGDAFDEPVLLIKCAWGGKSLAVDFRPPSAGKLPYSLGQKDDAAIAQDPAIIGKYYRETLALTKAALANIKEIVPGSDGNYVLAGFGWHQGWNDRINDRFNAEYETNMVCFICDIRKDLDAPALPFVIAETGMTGPEEKNPRALSLMKAQAAVAEHQEFKGNVAFVSTRAFWRPEDQSPTKQGYHWNSNAETYYLIGKAMGEAMKQLMGALDRVSARPELTITTLGFGSCARQERPQPIWDTIHATRCDAFVLLGDNIYADTSDPAVFRQKYALLASVPGFTKLRQSTPLLATWDDHDYGTNDGGAGFFGAAAAQKEFCDFFQVPATSPLRSTPGVYHCVNLGPDGKRVQVILLDTRMFRSPLKKDSANPKVTIPNTDPDATVLGEAQWAWFERRLREPAEIRVVVSSIQLIANEHGSEKWDNFPKERARFLELLRRTQAKGVVVISGDRHMAELSALTPADGVSYPLYDLTTSGLNLEIPPKLAAKSDKPNKPKEAAPKRPQINRYRLHERPYTGSNFGLMRVQWDGPNPSLRLEVCGLEGKVVLSRDIRFAEIH